MPAASIVDDRSTYLVADDETRLVYARAPSASVASAVTCGILNSYVITLPTGIPHLRDKWDGYDFANELYMAEFSFAEGWRFVPFPGNLAREDLLRNRELAARRAYYIHSLEVHCRSHLVRVAEYLPEDLAAFLHDELRDCDASRDIFSRSVEEYAEISEIDPLAAYDELRFKLKSSGLVRLRAYAQQQKFMMRMNACETEEDFARVFAQFFEATTGKALA